MVLRRSAPHLFPELNRCLAGYAMIQTAPTGGSSEPLLAEVSKSAGLLPVSRVWMMGILCHQQYAQDLWILSRLLKPGGRIL